MRKTTTLFAAAALALAMSAGSAFACDKSNASACTKGASATAASATTASATTASASNASAKLTCNKSTEGVSTASADGCGDNCVLKTGKYAVANLKVNGMTCGGCENGLTGKFTSADGVLWVAHVSYKDGTAKVVYDKSLTNPDQLTKVVSAAGFEGSLMPAVATTTQQVDGSKGGKAACTKGASLTDGAAGCSAHKGAATADKGATTDKGAKLASGKTCGGGACAQLTAAEHKAFCQKFCTADKAKAKVDSKTEKKSI